jgi:hypothetical protein
MQYEEILQISLELSSKGRRNGQIYSMHGEKRNACRSLVRRAHLDVGGRIMLKCILKKQDGVVWTALIWLRIGNSGRLL